MTHIAELAGKDFWSRRHFMERTARLALGVGLTTPFATGISQAQTAAKGAGKANALIYIFCNGGMTHLDTFDPKKEGSSVMGDTQLVNTNVDGIRFGNKLENLAKMADKLAIINGMFSTQGAHEQGRYIMRTGYEKRATIVHPTIGPFVQELLGKKNPKGILPDSVLVGSPTSNAGYLDPGLSPLPIADPSAGVPNTTILTEDARFKRRMEIASKLGKQFADKYKYSGPQSYVQYYDQATNLLSSDELEAFNITGEPNRNDYGMNSLGQGCLLARRLVERGVRVIEVNTGGYDMHENISTRLESVITPLDIAVSTLLKDLESKGLLDTTLVAVATEFGRTPDINMSSGRDHYPTAYSTVLAGGGIKGGQKWGETDPNGKKVISNQVTPQDFLATIGYGLGLDLERVVYSPSRRPFTFGDKGTPVTKLYGV